MKKSLLGAILVFALIITPIDTKAASTCSYKEQAELNEIANNVKANYEVIDIYDGKIVEMDSGEEVDPIVDYYVRGFKISILNVTDDVYVTVTNDYDSSIQTFYSKDAKDGIVSFETKNVAKVINYTIEVHSNKYTCIGELYRKLYIKTPVYNSQSNMAACDEYPEFYYCQEFIDGETVDFNTFLTRLEKYKSNKTEEEKKKEEENQSVIEKIKEFYEKNKIVIYIITIVVIISGVATTVILIKKRRSRVL